MEIDKEKMAEQAGQLKNQAAAMMAKVDVKKATGVADVFINKVFFFGKLFSALVMFGCVIAILGSLIYYIFCSGGSLKVPVFNAAVASEQAAQGESVNTDLEELLEKNAVQKKYQSKIETLLRTGNFDADRFDEIVEDLMYMDEGVRSAFINGAVKYVESTKKWSIEKAKKFDGEKCFRQYRELFTKAVNRVSEEEKDAKARQDTALGICGTACLGLILFLMIPLLIKIEENTRK